MSKHLEALEFVRRKVAELEQMEFRALITGPRIEQLQAPPALKDWKISIRRRPQADGSVEISVAAMRRTILIIVMTGVRDGFYAFPDGRKIPFCEPDEPESGESLEDEIARYLRLEYGERKSDSSSICAEDLTYVGEFVINGERVRYWSYPSNQEPVWATVADSGSFRRFSMTTVAPPENGR